MIYSGDLDSGRSIEIESTGGQTRISLSSRSTGSQQQQSQSFSTGDWTSRPTLHRDRDAQEFVLRVQTTAGTRALRISSAGISLLDNAPEPQGNEVPLRQLDQHTEPMQPMKPMAPMQPMAPMKMGDMEMKPGEMRMGSMKMALHDQSHTPPPAAELEAPQVLAREEPLKGRFCTQCGERAEAEDRFCHACGSRLRATAQVPSE